MRGRDRGGRGFHGKYTVKITAGGRTQEFQVNVSKNGPAAHRLVLK